MDTFSLSTRVSGSNYLEISMVTARMTHYAWRRMVGVQSLEMILVRSAQPQTVPEDTLAVYHSCYILLTVTSIVLEKYKSLQLSVWIT